MSQITPPVESAVTPHPLLPLSTDELQRGMDIVRAAGVVTSDRVLVSFAVLDEPTKDELATWTVGAPWDRRARFVLFDRDLGEVIELVVSLTAAAVVAEERVPGMQTALLGIECIEVMAALRTDERFQAALALRGITDMGMVQIDPWPAGRFGTPEEEGRRITRVVAYLRTDKTDNGYARPIEGILCYVDLATSEVIAVEDHGVVPLPPNDGNYHADRVANLRTDRRPLEIVQPEGPSFEVDGNEIRWQKWRLRASMHPIEGLVLHTLGYEDDGRLRPVLHRAALSEMVVPYGSTSPMHRWKNAFDAGEWGMGRMANSLELGCDCLGVIHYLDATMISEQGQPYTTKQAICVHEEDYGILWKHQDMHGGTTEVRRRRRLVISAIHTVGNYEYGFFWYLYEDAMIQLEVKLTGIMSTQAVAPGSTLDHAAWIAPGLAAPHHQHLFNVRLDFDVDGTTNSVYEVNVDPDPPGPDNPWGNAFRPVATLLDHEQAAQRNVDPARSRTWKIVNPSVHNALGEPVGWKLVPGSTPTLLGAPGSSIFSRAGFATHNLWVTPYERDERRAAGEYPNQHAGGDGLPAWTAADRPLADTDVVVWYTFGVTHIPRPEDWPVMPVEYTGFTLVPFGFFDRNPALDVAPSEKGCHA